MLMSRLEPPGSELEVASIRVSSSTIIMVDETERPSGACRAGMTTVVGRTTPK
jgi:hypothetical protein